MGGSRAEGNLLEGEGGFEGGLLRYGGLMERYGERRGGCPLGNLCGGDRNGGGELSSSCGLLCKGHWLCLRYGRGTRGVTEVLRRDVARRE